MRSLPVELLARIFLCGIEPRAPFLFTPDDPASPPHPDPFPHIVSHVSRLWRHVALHTPPLWATLHFRESVHINRAREYLARSTRSTTVLLDILLDSVSIHDHVPGITLFETELQLIFELIIPHVSRWHSFRLKICDSQCKALARKFLGDCPPAPNLNTLQLYHFEDYQTVQNLYLATYRHPVVIFRNCLPALKNVSLIGVNLPWDKSPYLQQLSTLELALHPDNIRPPYHWWENMLRLSPQLRSLFLHYSGPKQPSSDPWPSTDSSIHLPKLDHLSLTDLDPDYLCSLLSRLYLPSLTKLSLVLPEQNFTPFIDLVTRQQPPCPNSSDPYSLSLSATKEPTPITPFVPIPSLAAIESLVIRALECSFSSWLKLLRSLQNLRTLQVDFARVGAGFWTAFIQDCQVHACPHISCPDLVPDSLESSPEGHSAYADGSSFPAIVPFLERFKISGVSGKEIQKALHFRYQRLDGKAKCAPLAVPIKWIIQWRETKKDMDEDLRQLIDRGFWTPEHDPGLKVVIEAFYDEDIDEAEDDELSEGDALDFSELKDSLASSYKHEL